MKFYGEEEIIPVQTSIPTTSPMQNVPSLFNGFADRRTAHSSTAVWPPAWITQYDRHATGMDSQGNLTHRVRQRG